MGLAEANGDLDLIEAVLQLDGIGRPALEALRRQLSDVRVELFDVAAEVGGEMKAGRMSLEGIGEFSKNLNRAYRRYYGLKKQVDAVAVADDASSYEPPFGHPEGRPACWPTPESIATYNAGRGAAIQSQIDDELRGDFSDELAAAAVAPIDE